MDNLAQRNADAESSALEILRMVEFMTSILSDLVLRPEVNSHTKQRKSEASV